MRSVSFQAGAGTATGYLHDEGYAIAAREKRPCVVVCPGGGYNHLSPREGEPPALRFFARGYNAFVLRYSVRVEKTSPPVGLAPLCELSQTVAHIRENAAGYHIDESQIALLGFSAGGHLCACLGTLFDHEILKNSAGYGMNRPDAMILCYPVISSGEYAHEGSFDALAGSDEALRALLSPEKRVTKRTPPAFLWHAADDASVPVENTLQMAAALRKSRAPFECHIFPGGGHGLSLCNAETNIENRRCAAWLPLCFEWLSDLFSFRE